LSSDRGPGGKAPAITGGHGGGGEQLPGGHPEGEPAPGEKSQGSIQGVGQSEIYIQSPQHGGGATDPLDPALTGYPDSTVRAHIVTVSHEHRDHNAVQYVQPFSAMGQSSVKVVREGSYHQGDVTVTGFPSFHDARGGAERGPDTIFLIEAGAL